MLLQSSSQDLLRNLIILVILQIVAQQIVLQLLAPRIFGKVMGIPPLLLFAALLIGAKTGGVWGAFFAGPIAAVAFSMIQVYYERFAERIATLPHRASRYVARAPDAPRRRRPSRLPRERRAGSGRPARVGL